MFSMARIDQKMLKVTCFRKQNSVKQAWHINAINCQCYSTKDRTTTYYKILGISPDSTLHQIKQAYYRLSKVYHPDINKSESAIKQFQIISEAYEILSNEHSRQKYDVEHGLKEREYRSMRHGQMRYKPKGTPPSGMSSVYNFDEWYKEHYTTTVNKSFEDSRKSEIYEEHKRKEAEAAAKDFDVFGKGEVSTFFSVVAVLTTIILLVKKFPK